jgi:hypothetical protein
MPISYQRDDARQRILTVGEGPFLADDVIEILVRMRAEGVWHYSRINDLRRMSGQPAVSDLRRILEVARQPGPDGRAAGPIAVMVTDPALYGMVCAFASLAPPGAFGVFHDRADAEAWLASPTGTTDRKT